MLTECTTHVTHGPSWLPCFSAPESLMTCVWRILLGIQSFKGEDFVLTVFYPFYFSLVKQTILWSRQAQSPLICSRDFRSLHNQLSRRVHLRPHPSSCPISICFRRLLRYHRALPERQCRWCLSCLRNLWRIQFPRVLRWKIQSMITSTSRTFRRKSLHRRTYLQGNLVQHR